MASDKNLEEIEAYLSAQTDELNFLVQGLENYEPFLKLIEKFKRTSDSLDASWHLFTDPVKFNEARITKFAAMELIHIVDNLKSDLEKAHIELAKLKNPKELMNKDVDND